MLDAQMLSAFRQAGAIAASDDIKDGLTYDQEYIYEQAEAIAAAYGKDEYLSANMVRDLASEWLSGYVDGFASELQWHAD